MGQSFSFSVVLSAWIIDLSHAQCRYVAVDTYVYPLDTCSQYSKLSFFGASQQASSRYECEEGFVQQLSYTTADCSGTASRSPANSTDYNCDGSNADCQLVTFWYDLACDDSTVAEYQQILVANKCPADGGYEANCKSGSTPYDGRITECGAYSQSTMTEPSNLRDSSATSCSVGGLSASAQSELLTIVIIGVVVAVIVLCLCVACCICSARTKPKSRNQYQAKPEAATARKNYDLVQPAPQQHIQPSVFVAQPVTTRGVELPSYADVLPSYGDATAPSVYAQNEPLPQGWVELQSPDGRVYYQNNHTKKTQWTKPAPEKPLPAGWRRGYANDGRVYYLNDATKQTQWQFPSAPANNDPPAYNPYVAANAPPLEAYAMGENEPALDRMESPQYEGVGGITNQ